jgi:dihydroflavonol-4-reductase
MIVLVTGAAGFLGNHVARQLLARGVQVRVLVRARSNRRVLEGLGTEIVEGDLRDRASLEAAVRGARRVFHVAADYRLWARDPREIYESNVTGTRNLLEAAQRAGVERFVYTGTVATVAVDRPTLPNEATDTALEEMVGHYKRSKWLAEREVLKAVKSGLPAVVAMPTTPVGPGDWKPTPTGKIIVDFLNGRMPGYVNTGLNCVAVEDAAAGHLLVAEKGQIGERYLLGAENLSLKQLLDRLAQIAGKPAPKLRIPHALALLAAYGDTAVARLRGREPQIPVEGVKIARHVMFVDCSRATRELGFRPTAVTQALERAVRWYQEHGYGPTPGASSRTAVSAAGPGVPFGVAEDKYASPAGKQVA